MGQVKIFDNELEILIQRTATQVSFKTQPNKKLENVIEKIRKMHATTKRKVSFQNVNTKIQTNMQAEILRTSTFKIFSKFACQEIHWHWKRQLKSRKC